MTKAYLLILLSFIAYHSRAQEVTAEDIAGRWYSKVIMDDEEFHFLFDIRQAEESLIGYIDIPSHAIFRVHLDSLSYLHTGDLIIIDQGLDLSFTGKVDKTLDEVSGTISKDGFSNTLSLSKHPQVKRTQTIEEPIPYASQEVFFFNKDSIRLAGTITYPKDRVAAKVVVLISGSGPQNRDEEILGHKPFAILADHLTRNGIVVLRYDDRGYGQSGGNFRPATSLDYAYDALAAVQYLKNYCELTISEIGLIGHSEGGNIAPVVATMDSSVNFLVLLAAPGTSNLESYLVSLDLILKEYPETYDRDFPFFKSVYEDMASITDKGVLRDSLTRKFQSIANLMEEEEFTIYGGREQYITSQVNYHTSDWYHYYLQFDVSAYLKQLEIPILALNGDKDTSVESAYNLNGIATTLKESGNNEYETVELKNVNHFFQVSQDAKIESVYFNEETFSRVALSKITEWIKGF